jgi:hypothetical protein
VAELEAKLSGRPRPEQVVQFRLARWDGPDAMEHYPADWTDDEVIVETILAPLAKKFLFLSTGGEYLMPRWIDLLERAPSEFLNACRREWTFIEPQLQAEDRKRAEADERRRKQRLKAGK